MSDNVTQADSSWKSSLALIYPVVAAVILVILVFFFGVGASPEPVIPEPLIEESKRSKPKKKRTAKPETKPETAGLRKASQIVPNGESIKAQKPTSIKDVKKSKAAETKSGVCNKKNGVKKVSKPLVKREKTAAEIQREKERAEVKKELATGDWVTVGSAKEKKPKLLVSEEPETQTSQQTAPINSTKTSTVLTSHSTIKQSDLQTYTGKRTEAEIIAEAQAILAQKAAQTSTSKPEASVVTTQTPSTESKTSNKKTKSKSKSPEPDVATVKEQIKEQAPADVRPKILPEKPVAKVDPQPTKASKSMTSKILGKSEPSIQEKIEDAMKPAFDELGDWEQAKPQKMKNMKKRARKEK